MSRFSFLTLGLVLAGTQARAEKPTVTRAGREGLMGQGKTVSFTVLDVNARFAALKQVYTFNDEDGEPVDCECHGLKNAAGVQLALIELTTGSVTAFDVYEPTNACLDYRNGAPPKLAQTKEATCTALPVAKKRLRAAKRAFKAAGLDISRTPKPDWSRPRQRYGRWTKDVVMTKSAPNNVFDVATFTASVTWRGRTLDVRVRDIVAPTEMKGEVSVDLTHQSQVLYRARRPYDLIQAGRGDVSFPEGYMTPKGMVFLEVFESFTAMHGTGSSYNYGMTPPISIAGPKPKVAPKPSAIDLDLAAVDEFLNGIPAFLEGYGVFGNTTWDLPTDWCIEKLDVEAETTERCSVREVSGRRAAVVVFVKNCEPEHCDVDWGLISGQSGLRPSPMPLDFELVISPDNKSMFSGSTGLSQEGYTTTLARFNLTTFKLEALWDCAAPVLSPSQRWLVCRDASGDVYRLPINGGRLERVHKIKLGKAQIYADPHNGVNLPAVQFIKENRIRILTLTRSDKKIVEEAKWVD